MNTRLSTLEQVIFGYPVNQGVNVSTEAESNEREVEIYGYLADLGVLEQLARDHEEHEQWGLYIPRTSENAATGNIRVRRIEKGGNVTFIETSKIKQDDGNDEDENEVGKRRFEHFKLFATQGLVKRRYNIPAQDRADYLFEVDVFTTVDGGTCHWVKIDIELPEGRSADNLPELPFDLVDVRVIPPGHKSDEDLAFVRKLFDEHFNSRNAHL